MHITEVKAHGLALTLTHKKRCHWVFNGTGRPNRRVTDSHKGHENRLTKESFIAFWNISGSVWDCQKNILALGNLPDINLTGSIYAPALRRRATKLRKEGHILKPLLLWPPVGNCESADYLRKNKKQVTC